MDGNLPFPLSTLILYYLPYRIISHPFKIILHPFMIICHPFKIISHQASIYRSDCLHLDTPSQQFRSSSECHLSTPSPAVRALCLTRLQLPWANSLFLSITLPLSGFETFLGDPSLFKTFSSIPLPLYMRERRERECVCMWVCEWVCVCLCVCERVCVCVCVCIESLLSTPVHLKNWYALRPGTT